MGLPKAEARAAIRSAQVGEPWSLELRQLELELDERDGWVATGGVGFPELAGRADRLATPGSR